MSDRYLLLRNWEVHPSPPAVFTRCQGKGCGRTIEPGETCYQVNRLDQRSGGPNDPEARRYLCSACVAKIEDRLEHPVSRDRNPIRPFTEGDW